MADKRVYTLQINGVEESYKGIVKLSDVLDVFDGKISAINAVEKENIETKKTSKQVVDELTKVQEKLNQYDEEYQRLLAETKSKLAEKNKEIQNSVKESQAELTINNNVTASYKDKQALLTALGTKIKNYVAETAEQQEELQNLKTQYNNLNTELKLFDKELGHSQRFVGDYGIAAQDLKGELRELQEGLANMLAQGVSPLDPAFQSLAERAGNIKDAISDAQAEVNRFADDAMRINDVVNVAESATSVFGLYQSTMVAFGVENENAAKAIAKLQAVMTTLAALQKLSKNLTDSSSASYKLYHKALQILGIEKQKDITATATLTATQGGLTSSTVAGTTATMAQAGAMEVATVATNTTSTAMKGLKKAIMATGIGALVVLIGVLIANFDKIINLFKGSDESLGKLKSTTDAYNISFRDTNREQEYNIKLIKIKGATNSQIIKQQQKNNRENIADAEKTLDEINALAEKAQTGWRKFWGKGIKQEFKDALDEQNKILQGFYNEQNKLNDEADLQAEQDAEDAVKAAKEAAKKAREEREKALKELVSDTQKMLENTQKLYSANAKEALAIEKKSIQDIKAVNQEQLDYKLSLLKENREKENKLIQEELEKQVKLVEEEYDKLIEKATELKQDTEQLEADKASRVAAIREEARLKNEKSENEHSAYILKEQETLNKQIINNTKKTLTEVQKTLDDQFKNIKQNSIDPIKTGGFFDIIDLNKTRERLADVKLMYMNLADSLDPDGLNMKEISAKWDKYLGDIKEQYGEDSDEFKNAQLEKTNAFNKYGQDYKIALQGVDDASKAEGDVLKEYWGSVSDAIAENFAIINESVLGPLFDGFNALLGLQIEEAQEALDKVSELHDKAVEQVTDSQNKIKQLNDDMKNASGQQLEAMKTQLAEEMGMLVERENEEKRLAKEKERAEAELAKKEKQKKKLELAQSLIMAIVNTAVGATKAMEWGIPLGPIFAGVIGAMGALQAGVIVKQMSKLADGGLVEGRSHSQGGVRGTGAFANIEVEGGEFVVNKASTAKYMPLIQAINNDNPSKVKVLAASKLNKYAEGGQVNFEGVSNTLAQNNQLRNLQNSIDNIDFQPVVGVLDIVKGINRVSRVQDLAGK